MVGFSMLIKFEKKTKGNSNKANLSKWREGESLGARKAFLLNSQPEGDMKKG